MFRRPKKWIWGWGGVSSNVRWSHQGLNIHGSKAWDCHDWTGSIVKVEMDRYRYVCFQKLIWLKILFDWKFYLISVVHLVTYYFRWSSHSYTIYTHSYYYMYNIYTYYFQIKWLKLLKIYIIVIKIESLLKNT